MTTHPGDDDSQPTSPLLSKALELISGKWRLALLLALGEQTRRYGELSDLLPGISEKVLASELKALVALGAAERTAYAEIPPRVEYTLSEKGRQALPILNQLPELGRLFN